MNQRSDSDFCFFSVARMQEDVEYFCSTNTTKKRPGQIKPYFSMRLVENAGSQDSWINYLPERDEPIVGQQENGSGFFRCQGSGEPPEMERPCAGIRKSALLWMTDWGDKIEGLSSRNLFHPAFNRRKQWARATGQGT